MIKGVVVKRLERYKDKRGSLAEIYRSDEVNFKPVMAYISVTKPGVVRGPHEHKKQSDCFVFAGPGNFELHLWDKRKGSAAKGEYLKIEAGEDNPTMVIVPPGVVHGYKCVSKIDGWCVNFPDELYRGKDKKEDVDEIRWETDRNSPYKIV
ncbi:dTDP-4-dehydrorhamnose 3,5-epimerase [Candidatus Falkowbacteria bacterium CG_4_9_14_3_um_filter_36_9]|uniref:dTDP-4-dehydrorhamnose 3,5-epimerase n=1 Tax=Candidatus Falkowbacteria bacterium CG02_land_8_20_14_3_00_36_14 TaxID=1974560 RepID=A0A2M7DK94_9BACT|nr:MAG: dTDP-4-dehydrorhamnose 3,5-epimerase [Candidatus Falkowbacteria bacterium CG02_land_8_20_14_3_00_36_14]PIX11286.1 MAG: dTDP-4-dehydrorhamnose 3,5-epimerase [Candidatus Falkowbacteria bacterium CG_4_8_14_3_um_filter_36_11]PJA11141.1 MAG: dTDP-4-dehydrorhamnose 3,5-epimerase [Candidatus Falkowbacteria bacterium CG_4_10_14_0_2_um_filter_36_22]PJB20427.1 MAG: dTDP-4-dehydrorhamnose 3,5-epimerase [Candidatus Falkowbacteria bacterium CG_4_9_14_3_um_filter_36_9]